MENNPKLTLRFSLKKLFFMILGVILLINKAGAMATHDSQWVERTVNRINSAMQNDGGYLDFALKEPTAFDTYYDLHTLQILGEESNFDPEPWIWTLYNEGKFQNGLNSSLLNTYFSVQSLLTLEKSIPEKDRIITYVMSLQTPEGYFLEDKQDINFPLPLVATKQGVAILRLLDAKVDLSQTQEWLLGLWQEWKVKELSQANEINILMAILIALDDTGYAPEKILEEDLELIAQRLTATFAQSEWERDTFLADAVDALEVVRRYQLGFQIPEGVVKEIRQRQNPDGGFYSFGYGPSDSFGTYCAVRLLQFAEPNYYSETIVETVQNLQLSNGGFVWWGSTGSSNPLLTAAVLATLTYIAPDQIQAERVYDFLEMSWHRGLTAEEISWKTLVAIYKVAPAFGLDVALWKDELVTLANRDLANISEQVGDKLSQLDEMSSIDEITKKNIKTKIMLMEYHIMEMLYLLGEEPDSEPLTCQLLPTLYNQDGSYGNDETDLLVTSMALVFKKFINDPTDLPTSLNWLKAQCLADGSFPSSSVKINSDRIFSTTLGYLALEVWGEADLKVQANAQEWLQGRKDPLGGIRNQYTLEADEGDSATIEEYTNMIWTCFGVQLMRLFSDGGEEEVLQWFLFAI